MSTHGVRPVAAALAAATVVMLMLSGCGNVVSATEAGRLGMSMDDAGHPMAVVLTCGRSTPTVDLSEGRPANDDGKKPNVHRGSWTARAAYTGVESFPISPSSPSSTASDGWTLTGRGPGELETDRLFVLTGGTTQHDDDYLQQVSFRMSDLAALPPHGVRIEGGTLTPAQFAAYRCAD